MDAKFQVITVIRLRCKRGGGVGWLREWEVTFSKLVCFLFSNGKDAVTLTRNVKSDFINLNNTMRLKLLSVYS